MRWGGAAQEGVRWLGPGARGVAWGGRDGATCDAPAKRGGARSRGYCGTARAIVQRAHCGGKITRGQRAVSGVQKTRAPAG